MSNKQANSTFAIPTLQDLALDALYAIGELYDDDEFESLKAQGDLELVRRRFCFADCDDFAFAVSVLTGWQVVSVNSKSHGPCHRLNVDDEGRLVDVMGYVTLDGLRRRYKARDLYVHEGSGVGQSLIDRDDDLKRIVSVMLYLKHEPFTGLAERAREFILKGSYFGDGEVGVQPVAHEPSPRTKRARP